MLLGVCAQVSLVVVRVVLLEHLRCCGLLQLMLLLDDAILVLLGSVRLQLYCRSAQSSCEAAASLLYVFAVRRQRLSRLVELHVYLLVAPTEGGIREGSEIAWFDIVRFSKDDGSDSEGVEMALSLSMVLQAIRE